MNDIEFKLALNERLCDLAELILHQYDPCKKKGSACLVADPNPCCVYTRFGDKCPHWTGKCNFRNIWCRFWICETAIKNTQPECLEVLKSIEQIGRLHGLIGSPFFGDDYVGADKPNKSP